MHILLACSPNEEPYYHAALCCVYVTLWTAFAFAFVIKHFTSRKIILMLPQSTSDPCNIVLSFLVMNFFSVPKHLQKATTAWWIICVNTPSYKSTHLQDLPSEMHRFCHAYCFSYRNIECGVCCIMETNVFIQRFSSWTAVSFTQHHTLSQLPISALVFFSLSLYSSWCMERLLSYGVCL